MEFHGDLTIRNCVRNALLRISYTTSFYTLACYSVKDSAARIAHKGAILQRKSYRITRKHTLDLTNTLLSNRYAMTESSPISVFTLK